MSRRALGQGGVVKNPILFFVLTAICWFLTIVLLVRFVVTIAGKGDSNLAVVEAPGSAFFEIEEAGEVSLWHNFEDFRGGRTVNNDRQLPSGYSFELKELGSSTAIPFMVSKMDSTYTSPSVAKTGLGMFMVTSPGDYELTVTAPPGQERIISLD